MRLVASLALLLALTGCGASQPVANVAEGAHDGAFVPTAHREGSSVVLPLVFPDGTQADLLYPPRLDIAGLGVTPYTSGELRGKSPDPERSDVVGRDFWILHGDLRELLATLDGGRPPRLLGTYGGVGDRTVGFWGLRDGPYLGFQFGRWAVLVYDYTDRAAMTDSERASWAASLSGRETADGFLLLEGSGELRLARPGEHAGPELRFGDNPDHGLSLLPGKCALFRNMHDAVAGIRRVDRSPGFASWCLSSWMGVQATGSESFIDGLLRNLEIGDVRSGSPVPAE